MVEHCGWFDRSLKWVDCEYRINCLWLWDRGNTQG
jgi:hypothetical protein